jgi:lipid-A-disaccharide synthase
MKQHKPTIALVAGEASGDQLGAALIERLREHYPQALFIGIGGRKMKAAGMETWWDAEELAVFGLFEVLSHFPRLLRLRRELYRRLVDLKPDVFIGIDAPDFNLGLEIKLRRQGLRTIHYVSPTVWFWRQKRVHKIARAADLVMCLFPFEPEFYEGFGVSATYVGHPLADQIAPDHDPASARTKLGLDSHATTVSLLPGSRVSELARLAVPMVEAARLLSSRQPGLQFVAAMASDRVSLVFREAMASVGFEDITLVDLDPRTVMAAADVVMCASGTATLETMLVNRPMVMIYQISPASYNLLKYVLRVKPQLFSLPNILAGEPLIPELVQQQANSENLVFEVGRMLDDDNLREGLQERFLEIHTRLRCDASGRAAAAVSRLLEEPRSS